MLSNFPSAIWGSQASREPCKTQQRKENSHELSLAFTEGNNFKYWFVPPLTGRQLHRRSKETQKFMREQGVETSI